MYKNLRKAVLIFIISLISLINYGQIIADHSIVEDFDKIPAYYVNEVKKMWLVYAGESHSYAIRAGLANLESQYPQFDANVRESGTPDPYTTSALRASAGTWGDYSNSSGWIYNYGEEDWFTNSTALSRTKAGISYCNSHSLTISAIGLGWCWDLVGLSSTSGLGSADPVSGNIWYGVSKQGPQGDRGWGLDDADYAITGNSVNLDTYLRATQDYIDYCAANSIATKVFFTTGTVDAIFGEAGFGGYLKNEKIRSYVKANASRILFDYADILCYNNDGTTLNTSWNGHSYPRITTANQGNADIGHIGTTGALRLAKAMWWMLARMAGWDGNTTSSIPVTGVTVAGTGGATTITTQNGTLQLSATVTPSNATTKSVTWSISNGTGQASINTSGLVTAIAGGTVTARATAADGSGVSGTLVITISNQVIPVTGITVTGAGGAATITAENGTLQLTAAILPANATNKAVTWSISNGTGQASISASGLVTALTNGTVTARAAAADGSGVYGTLTITISSQNIPVSGITVVGTGGATTITTQNGTLQLSATVTPSNATNKSVTWSISNGTGQASISTSGLVTAITDGTVTARATAADGSGVYGTLVITISNQVILVKEISVTGSKGTNTIITNRGSLQLNSTVSPSNATNQTVTWSIINGTGQASINSSGIVTAISNGTVTANATAADGSGIIGSLVISILNQVTLITGITITGEGGVSTISEGNGTLQLLATIAPVYATIQIVTWSITNVTGQASISETGLVTATGSGKVTAKAKATDGSGAEGIFEITIMRKSTDPLVVIVGEDEIKIPLDEDCTDCKICLYNLNGHLIDNKLVDSNIPMFDTSTLRPGIYIIVLNNNAILKVGKVIIH